MRAVLTIAIAAVAVLGLSVTTTSANEVVRQVEQQWRRAKNPLEKRDAVRSLEGAGLAGLPVYDTVLADPYWTIRAPVVNQLRNLSTPDDRAKLAQHMVGVKDLKAKHQYFWAYANSNLTS